jgi:LCP family protein required for cell wall assembly
LTNDFTPSIKRRKFSKFRAGLKPVTTKIFTPLLAVLVGFGTFIGATWIDLRNSVGGLSLSQLTTRPPVDPLAGNSVNILAIAYDSYGQDGGKITNQNMGTSNADTNILIHISSDRSNIELISIPRDLLINVPDCETASNGTVWGGYRMFNTAFGWAYAQTQDIQEAANCEVQTVEQMTGIRVDYTAVVNFQGFYDIVDSLDGVSLCIPEAVGPIYYAGSLTLDAGYQTLTAWEATQYGRARLGIDDGSDIARMKRQQKLLAAIGKKALSQVNIVNVNGLYDFIKASLKSVNASFSLEDIVGLAFSLRNINLSNVAAFTVPFTSAGADNPGRLVLASNADDMWNKIRIDQPLFPLTVPQPSASSSSTSSSTSSSSSSLSTSTSSNANNNAENSDSNSSETQLNETTVAPTETSTDSEFDYTVPAAETGC